MNTAFIPSQDFTEKNDALVVCAYSDDDAVKICSAHLVAPLQELIAKAVRKCDHFKAKSGETFKIFHADDDAPTHIIVLGLGAFDKITEQSLQQAGGKLFPALKPLQCETPALALDSLPALDCCAAGTIGANILYGFKLRSYTFEKYKSEPKGDEKSAKPKKMKRMDIVSSYYADIQEAYTLLECTAEGVFFARDFVNEPPNALYPESYAQTLKDDLKPLGIQVEILDDKKMEKMGMGAITAVGKGSERKPRMVIMIWNGTGQKETGAPLALVGKGVTFDTGGISLKPGAGMDEMKMDMGGSAAVAGTMKALALRKSKSYVIGVVGLAENMPSSNAYRPGDIVKSYSGKTIEVLNTDAEGRLVLADCLTYVQKTYKPHSIIDLATLTGAMMVALGHEYCGCFATDDDFWNKISAAGKDTDEKIWRMPLDTEWKKQVESNVADIQNLGKTGRWAGACTAAGFLHHFIEDDTHWAHMDIAGTAWRKSDLPTVPKYGTGYGVRLLDRMIADHYEDA